MKISHRFTENWFATSRIVLFLPLSLSFAHPMETVIWLTAIIEANPSEDYRKRDGTITHITYMP